MKRFLKNLFWFLLPLIVFALVSEILLRNIPNDYKNKRAYLDENAGRLSILILGSSHSLTALNPDYFSKPSFNAAYVSQTIDIDYCIFKKYKSQLNQLEYIILAISYDTMFEQMENTSENWRIKNYVLYFQTDVSGKIRDHSEILSNKLWFNLYRMANYYILRKNPVNCSLNGWEERHSSPKTDLIRSGEKRALLHTHNDSICFAKNTQLLKTFIEEAAEKNIHIILYSTPAYKSYVRSMNPEQWNKTLNLIDLLTNTYQNVSYYNFLTDPAFTETDYFDADHLNINGAQKLSRMLNERIKN